MIHSLDTCRFCSVDIKPIRDQWRRMPGLVCCRNCWDTLKELAKQSKNDD